MSAGDWYLAIFSLGCGIGIPAFWIMALATGKVAEVKEGRGDIWFHIAAELVTGALLIAAAMAVFSAPDGSAARAATAFALGMLVYTLIQSPGYYVARGDKAMTAMFAGVWVPTIGALLVRFT